MHGVTTAIVLFIFGCIAYPRLVKRRTQYYAAVAAILFLMLLGCVDEMLGGAGAFHHFFGAMMYLVDFTAMLMLVMSTGGLTVRELAGHMGEAFEEFRLGADAGKPLIVPLTGEQPKPKKDRPVAGAIEMEDEIAATVSAPAPVPPRVAKRPPRDNSAIPLE